MYRRTHIVIKLIPHVVSKIPSQRVIPSQASKTIALNLGKSSRHCFGWRLKRRSFCKSNFSVTFFSASQIQTWKVTTSQWVTDKMSKSQIGGSTFLHCWRGRTFLILRQLYRRQKINSCVVAANASNSPSPPGFHHLVIRKISAKNEILSFSSFFFRRSFQLRGLGK